MASHGNNNNNHNNHNNHHNRSTKRGPPLVLEGEMAFQEEGSADIKRGRVTIVCHAIAAAGGGATGNDYELFEDASAMRDVLLPPADARPALYAANPPPPNHTATEHRPIAWRQEVHAPPAHLARLHRTDFMVSAPWQINGSQVDVSLFLITFLTLNYDVVGMLRSMEPSHRLTLPAPLQDFLRITQMMRGTVGTPPGPGERDPLVRALVRDRAAWQAGFGGEGVPGSLEDVLNSLLWAKDQTEKHAVAHLGAGLLGRALDFEVSCISCGFSRSFNVAAHPASTLPKAVKVSFEGQDGRSLADLITAALGDRSTHLSPAQEASHMAVFRADHQQQRRACPCQDASRRLVHQPANPFVMVDIDFPDDEASNLLAAKRVGIETLELHGVTYRLYLAAYRLKQGKPPAAHYVAEGRLREGDNLVRYNTLGGAGREASLLGPTNKWIYLEGRPRTQAYNLVCLVYIRQL